MSRNERNDIKTLRRVFTAQYSTVFERKTEVLNAEPGNNRMAASQALLSSLVRFLGDSLLPLSL